MPWQIPSFVNPFACTAADRAAATAAAVESAAAAALNNARAALAKQVFPIVHLWRESEAHPNGSVPGWLEVGTPAFLPQYGASEKLQSLADQIPPSLRNSQRVLPTIERGMLGAKTTAYTNLKIGTYTLEHSTKYRKGAPGNKIKCLRITDHDNISSVLIHDAINDSAWNLTGCVAPGMGRNPGAGGGILQSAAAMDVIWAYLGGHEEGKTVKLVVWSNIPGETRTKKTWSRLN